MLLFSLFIHTFTTTPIKLSSTITISPNVRGLNGNLSYTKSLHISTLDNTLLFLLQTASVDSISKYLHLIQDLFNYLFSSIFIFTTRKCYICFIFNFFTIPYNVRYHPGKSFYHIVTTTILTSFLWIIKPTPMTSY